MSRQKNSILINEHALNRETFLLCNDPGKTGSNFFCYGAITKEYFHFHTENA